MNQSPVTRTPVEQLRLDRENPRLVGALTESSDETIIAHLYRREALGEILQSISTNGYLDIEPLVATRPNASEALIVLEGNRRLAALRLLREPDLVTRIASSCNLRISIPSIADELQATLDAVSVCVVPSRDSARSFIGFKHINGPSKWDAYAKARFAAKWYQDKKSDGVNLTDVANAIGDKHDTVKRMVSAVYVLDQAANEGLYTLSDRYSARFSFSHLYIALSRSQYMEYLGLEAGWARHDPTPNQVPSSKFKHLRQVLRWLHGSKSDDLPPIVRSQNPDIKRLGEVLSDTQGLHILETTGNLDEAHASTVPIDRQLTASLIRARDDIRDAAGSLRAYDGRDQSLLDIAEDVRETATAVYERMAKKRRDALLAQ